MSMEKLVEWELEGETKVLGENLPQWHFVHCKSHMTWPGLKPGPRSGKLVTNHLSYGMVISQLTHCSSCQLRTHDWLRTQSQSHIVTDAQSVSKFWCLYYCLTVMVLFFLWGALSDQRAGLSFAYAADPCQCSHSRVWVPRVCLLYMLLALQAQSFSGPSPLGLVTIFYCLRFETSLFVTSYDSQGHDGGIWPRLQTGTLWLQLVSLYNLGMSCTENNIPKNTSVVACLFVAVKTCLFSCLFRLVVGGVQLGPFSMAATDWPIVPCHGWLWWWKIWWNEDWQGKPKYSEKTRHRATLSTTNPTWPDPGPNPGCCGEKPAPNRLSYGAALI
jgi:hypothetical protein